MPSPRWLGLAVLACCLAGCAPGTTMSPGSDPAVDSLRAENVELRDRNRTLRDSLRFHDDVQTGQYARDLRTLNDRLNRLSYEVRLLRNGGLTVAQLPVDSLFASADSLSEAGVARLQSIADQLQQTYPDRTVRVEGHADNVPLQGALKKRFSSNWELSSARAIAVTRRLIDLSSVDDDQFVAVAYGDTRPRASNDTERGRRRNRRVRIAVLPRPKNDVRPFETSW